MLAQRLSESQRSVQQRAAPRGVIAGAISSPYKDSHPMLHLQRTLGNRGVAQLLQSQRLSAEGGIRDLQPKLMVGAAGDQYEQEADRVAGQVLSMSNAGVARALQRVALPEEEEKQQVQMKPLAASITPLGQRQTTTVEEEEELLTKSAAGAVGLGMQRQMSTEEEEEVLQAKQSESHAGSFDAGEEVERQVSLSKGGGGPLPDMVRAFMEPRFGADFSQVRVHAGREAEQMNEAVGAQAFTHGSDIYFGAGHSPTDLALTAHELTHVVQQTGGTSLQTKGQESVPSAHTGSSIQRVYGACAAGGSPCVSCAAEEMPIQHKLAPIPNDRDRAVERVMAQRRTAGAGVSRARGSQISRAPEAVQRYSWDEFVGDVEDVGGSVVEGVQEAGEAVVEGAEAVGEAVVEGAEAVGEAVTAGAEAVGEAAGVVGEAVSGAVDWVLTEAGQAALAGANALAGLVGGSVTVGPSGLIISIPEIELFDSFEQEMIPPTPRVYVPLLAAGAVLGPVVLGGSVGIPLGAPTVTVYLGPGRVQNITIRIDPAASTYSASGELYLGAALNAYMQTGAAVRVDALTMIPTEPPIPVQAALEGGLLLTLQGSVPGSITRGVTLAYSAGTISLDLTQTLQLGVILEADLDAYLNAQLYEIELCEFIWPLEHWETSAAVEYSLPLSLSFSGGAATITIGSVSSTPMPVEDIETALERFRPESHCLGLEEIIEELCEREILPPEVCEALEGEPATGIAGSCVANDNLGEVADSFISRCRKASIRSEFPGELLQDTLGNIKKGKTAKHKKAWKLLNDNRFKKPGVSATAEPHPTAIDSTRAGSRLNYGAVYTHAMTSSTGDVRDLSGVLVTEEVTVGRDDFGTGWGGVPIGTITTRLNSRGKMNDRIGTPAAMIHRLMPKVRRLPAVFETPQTLHWQDSTGNWNQFTPVDITFTVRRSTVGDLEAVTEDNSVKVVQVYTGPPPGGGGP